MSHNEQSFPESGFLEPAGVTAFERLAALPDVALEQLAPEGGRLHRVGMSGIQVMLGIESEEGDLLALPGRADAFVSLDEPRAKGIHMSRLFLGLQRELERSSFGPQSVDEILRTFLASHEGLSEEAFLACSYLHVARRPSLLSDYSAWRHYPVCVAARRGRDGQTTHQLTFEVEYSSACPCSAALTRQLLADRFQRDFAHHRWINISQVTDWLNVHGTLGIPHSQRSRAEISVRLNQPVTSYPIAALVDRCERVLATPVQTAVKRSDEQEFARLNGANVMFCEDAARRLKSSLDETSDVADFLIKVHHFESLHPHDAVAMVAKGLEGGFHV